jgi:hypothetical protein
VRRTGSTVTCANLADLYMARWQRVLARLAGKRRKKSSDSRPRTNRRIGIVSPLTKILGAIDLVAIDAHSPFTAIIPRRRGCSVVHSTSGDSAGMRKIADGADLELVAALCKRRRSLNRAVVPSPFITWQITPLWFKPASLTYVDRLGMPYPYQNAAISCYYREDMPWSHSNGRRRCAVSSSSDSPCRSLLKYRLSHRPLPLSIP